MDNTQIIGWVINGGFGLLLLAVTVFVNSMRRAFERLEGEQSKLQIAHATLAARVSAEREDTLRSLSRIEKAVGSANRKLDDMRASKASPSSEDDDT